MYHRLLHNVSGGLTHMNQPVPSEELLLTNFVVLACLSLFCHTDITSAQGIDRRMDSRVAAILYEFASCRLQVLTKELMVVSYIPVISPLPKGFSGSWDL